MHLRIPGVEYIQMIRQPRVLNFAIGIICQSRVRPNLTINLEAYFCHVYFHNGCALLDIGLCDRPIPRPEHSYRVWCVCVCV